MASVFETIDRLPKMGISKTFGGPLVVVVLAAILLTAASPSFGIGGGQPTARDPAAVEIIASRSGGYLEVFLATNGQTAQLLFPGLSEKLTSDDGAVDFATAQAESGLLADELSAMVALSEPSSSHSVEGISMSVHPPDVAVAFTDPFDSISAISFCTSPRDGVAVGMSEVQVFLGMIANTGDNRKSFSLRLPSQETGMVSVTLKEYEDGRLVQTSREEIPSADGLAIDLFAS